VLALAAILFWSVVNQHVPLLAPALACVGIVIVAKHIKHLKIRSWTVICSEQGSMVAYIPHDACDETDRKAFEDAYVKAFSAANPSPPGKRDPEL
jgi:hypothetical protein